MDRSKLRKLVIARDGECQVSRWEVETGVPLPERHDCGPHLTLEHLTAVHSHLDVRRDDLGHCVAVCWNLNGLTLRLTPRTMRDWSRDRLRAMYPVCTGETP